MEKLIENFICGDSQVINELSTHFIYGELLEKQYFNGNETVLKNEVIKIFDMKNKVERGNGNLRIKIKKNDKNIFDQKIVSELPQLRLYGCIRVGENLSKNN